MNRLLNRLQLVIRSAGLLCLLLTSVSFGQEYAGRPIVSTEVRGVGKEDAAALVRSLGLSAGTVLRPAQLDEAIVTTYAKGNYDSLFVYAEERAAGIAIEIVAVRIRKIKTIRFTGIDPDVLDEVRSRVNWEEGQGVDPRVFQILQEKIKTAYEARGYFNADVKLTAKQVEPGVDEVEVAVEAKEPTVVGSVTVTAGDKSEERSMLAEVTLKRGMPYSRASTEESIERINAYLQSNQYTTSRVEDWSLRFSLDRKSVDVTFMVKLGDRFQFQFFGNHVFDEYELRSLLTDEIISQVNSSARIVELIEDKYRASGYHFVKVTVATMQRSDSSNRPITIFRFDIDEGQKILIDRVHFTGGLADRTDQDLSELFLAGAAGVIKRKVYWEAGLRDSVREFKYRLERQGYLSASVSLPRAAFTEDNRGVELFIDIELGSQTVVRDVLISGNQYLTTERILEILGVGKGQPFDRQKFTEGKEALLRAYRKAGYIDVKLAQEIDKNGGVELSRDLKAATLRVDVIEGTRFYVGQIVVEGNGKTKPHVILRELKIRSGDPLDPGLLSRSEEDVNALGLFSRVEILPTQSAKDKDRKDLKVVVRENRPGIGEVGLGGFYEDPRFRLRTFLGVTYRNLFGLNQTGSGRLELSVPFSRQKSFVPFLEYSGALGYRSPYPFEIPVTFIGQLTFDSFEVRTEGTDVTLQSRTKIEGRVEKKIGSHLTGIYRIYQLERTKTEILDRPETGKIDLIGSTGPGVILDFRDDIYNPTKGSIHSLNVEVASPLLLSQEDIAFVMALGRNSFYVPLIAGVGLSLYGGVGYAQTLLTGKPIPSARLTSDLSLGGRGSIRGFSVRRFSPIGDPSNPTVETTAFYNARAEVTVPLFESVSGAIFFDTGQIYPNLRPDNRHDGVGLGIRYKTPVGPIVVDIAQGIGEDREELKFYFTVGTL